MKSKLVQDYHRETEERLDALETIGEVQTQDHSVDEENTNSVHAAQNSSGVTTESPHSALGRCFYCGKTHGADEHCENDDLMFFDESPEVLRKGFNK